MKKKIILLIKTSRPIFWPGTVFAYLLGFISLNYNWDIYGWIGLVFVTFPLNFIIFGMNDIADMKTDAGNPRKGGWQGNILNKNNVSIVKAAIVALIVIFFVTFLFLNKYIEAFLILTMAFLGYIYSFKPWRLKSRPFLDSLENGLGMLSVFLLGFSLSHNGVFYFGEIPRIIWLIVAGVIMIHVLFTLMDYDIDKKFNDLTTGIFLGKRLTAIITASVFLFLFFLSPDHTTIKLYLLLSVLLSIVILILPRRKIISSICWILILGFPLICVYFFVFDFQYIKFLLTS